MRTRDAIALLTLAALGGIAALPRPTIDNSVSALLTSDDEDARDYAKFAETFGTDEIIVAHLTGDDTKKLAAHTASTAAAFRQHVDLVVDPTEIYADTFAVLLDDDFAAEADVRAFSGPLGRRLGLFEPGRAATVYGFARTAAPAKHAALAEAIEEARRRAKRDGIDLRVAGAPLLNLALDRAGRKVAEAALPLLVAVCLIVCLLALRSVRGTIAVFVPAGLTVLASDGAYALTGLTTNVVVDIAKPLLFVLLLAGALHVAAAYRAHFDGDPSAAAEAAVRDKGRAAVLALLTTAIGFSSLALSPIPPIRRFGLVAAIGLVFGALPVLVVVPALAVRVWPKPRPLDDDRLALLAMRLVAVGGRHRLPMIAVALVTSAVGAWAFTTLPVEPHAIRYFDEADPVRADYDALQSAGFGLQSLEIVVTSTAPLTTRRAIEKLDALARSIESNDGVRTAIGLPLFLREARYVATKRDELPDGAFTKTVLADPPPALAFFLTKDERTARISATIATLDADEMDRIAAAVDASGLDVTVTGSYRLLLGAQRGLLKTLIESLGLTFVLMQIILLLAVRSIRLGLAAIVPNVLPVATGFVAMVLLDIRLDIGTAMTAAIALGIAVDDTLHFVLAYQRHGLERAARTTGQAIVTSSIVIGAGFAVLVTSDFGPTRSFGILAAIAMGAALLADLLVLPAVLPKRG